MATPPETLEQQLIADLRTRSERFADEEFMADLYRALCNNIWFKDDPAEHVAVSWQRAQDIVDELRATVGAPAISLVQTGGEGEVAPSVDEELGRLGWRHRALDTSEHDARHLESPEDPPPASRPGPQSATPGG